MIKKNVGILLPISALPGNHGIGDFSIYAYQFIDWLKEHHYHYWQILPLNPVGPGNSPYMTLCSEAIDIRYISLQDLVDEGLLKRVPDYKPRTTYVKYDEVLAFKDKYLRKAFKKSTYNLRRFKKENPWSVEYAKYLILKRINDNKPWNEWWIKEVPENEKPEIDYHVWCQYVAAKQWNKIFKYADSNNVQLIADCPFYVGLDSVDCYLNKDEFLLDENDHPTVVSGCPPDAFSDDGQLWGTPIYNFEKMKENGYRFLVNRISHLASHCHYLRLDHFRAFDTYCVIPAEDDNARRGKWLVGPRFDFFDTLYREHPDIKLIAEDLGEMFDSVIELRDHYNLPGMRVYEFCIFDDLPLSDKFVVYPGTHDNQTLYGWYKSLGEWHIDFLNKKFNNPKNLYNAIFDYIWNVGSFITIFQLQDLLKLDDRARINSPGTIGEPNWCFKLKDMSWINKVKYGQ